jgi:hypothetical protein
MVPPEVSVLPDMLKDPEIITLPDTTIEPDTMGLSIIILFLYKYLNLF